MHKTVESGENMLLNYTFCNTTPEISSAKGPRAAFVSVETLGTTSPGRADQVTKTPGFQSQMKV